MLSEKIKQAFLEGLSLSVRLYDSDDLDEIIYLLKGQGILLHEVMEYDDLDSDFEKYLIINRRGKVKYTEICNFKKAIRNIFKVEFRNG